MANHISHAGIPFPVWGCKYTVLIPYLDADGDPVDPTSPDSEVSKDAGTYADCVNEVTTIAGSNGTGYLTLTASEMQGSAVIIAAKSANAKTTILTLNPYRMAQIGAPHQLASVVSGQNFSVTPADVEAVFGVRAIRLEGMWIQMQSPLADSENCAARPIGEYHFDTGEITVHPGFEPGSLTAGDFYTFVFPMGTGTILEQIVRSSGGGIA